MEEFNEPPSADLGDQLVALENEIKLLEIEIARTKSAGPGNYFMLDAYHLAQSRLPEKEERLANCYEQVRRLREQLRGSEN